MPEYPATVPAGSCPTEWLEPLGLRYGLRTIFSASRWS